MGSDEQGCHPPAPDPHPRDQERTGAVGDATAVSVGISSAPRDEVLVTQVEEQSLAQH